MAARLAKKPCTASMSGAWSTGAPPLPASMPKCAATHVSRNGAHQFLANGGTLENAQAMADHASPRTTQLYDRTGDEITLEKIERIAI